MGTGHSNLRNHDNMNEGGGILKREVIYLVMPVYYTEEGTSVTDYAAAKEKWDIVVDNKSSHFDALRSSLGYDSCIEFFYDTFYNRLFDVHPSCKHLFNHGVKAQGMKLAKLITLVLSMNAEPEKCNFLLTKLANAHNNRGIRAIEYGIIGEVLFWSLKRCLGSDYDDTTHQAWVRLFNAVLRVMVPIAVDYELTSAKNALAADGVTNATSNKDEEEGRQRESRKRARLGSITSSSDITDDNAELAFRTSNNT